MFYSNEINQRNFCFFDIKYQFYLKRSKCIKRYERKFRSMLRKKIEREHRYFQDVLNKYIRKTFHQNRRNVKRLKAYEKQIDDIVKISQILLISNLLFLVFIIFFMLILIILDKSYKINYQVFIKPLKGSTKVFTINNDMTLSLLKIKIYEEFKIPTQYQRLVLNGRHIINDKKLIYYNIKNLYY